MKNFSVKFKGKKMKNFHVELLFQIASESFLIYHATNINATTVMIRFN